MRSAPLLASLVFRAEAEAYGTSPEILLAIIGVSTSSAHALEIWLGTAEDFEARFAEIFDRVTDYGRIPSEEFRWSRAGSAWWRMGSLVCEEVMRLTADSRRTRGWIVESRAVAKAAA